MFQEKRIVDNKTKEKMKEVLKDIQSGKFTKQWMDEHKSGQKNFLKMREDLAKHPIEKVGKELRAMMPWIGKNKLVDKDKELAQSDSLKALIKYIIICKFYL